MQSAYHHCIGRPIAQHQQCRGVMLKDWIKRQRSHAEVLAMLEGIARLLAVLHAQGVVHRDIKPASILLMQHSMT